MSAVTGAVLGLQAFTDVGAQWGAALARSAALWDLTEDSEYFGPRSLMELARRERVSFDPRLSLHRWRRHPEGWWGTETPELLYLRDVRAVRLAGPAIQVRSLKYENPIELILAGAGLMLAGSVMAARFVRDWSANRRIGKAEARKAEAEARVSETWADREEAITETVTTWLAAEARRTSTPLPISEMTAITSMHNFPDLRRLIERPVTLELPKGLDPTEGDEAKE